MISPWSITIGMLCHVGSYLIRRRVVCQFMRAHISYASYVGNTNGCQMSRSNAFLGYIKLNKLMSRNLLCEICGINP